MHEGREVLILLNGQLLDRGRVYRDAQEQIRVRYPGWMGAAANEIHGPITEAFAANAEAAHGTFGDKRFAWVLMPGRDEPFEC